MDAPGFSALVKNFACLNDDEASSLRGLSQSYPYSQLIQMLYARASRDLELANHEEVLHHSAVYSTDRSILKWVMTSPRVGRIEVPVIADMAEVQPVAEAEIIVDAPASPVPGPVPIQPNETLISLTGDALRDDLVHELEKLQKLKHDFELSVAAFEKSAHAEPEVKRKGKQSSDSPADPLIEEIKATKKKLKSESPKQKEQNEIIDQFIKTQPIIPKASTVAPANDLAEDSGIFSDNIVSETLVNILLKQGKKDKAIEVLKKLIWKFPQKKAYFAAQIEDLKN